MIQIELDTKMKRKFDSEGKPSRRKFSERDGLSTKI